MGFVTLRDTDGNYFTVHTSALQGMEQQSVMVGISPEKYPTEPELKAPSYSGERSDEEKLAMVAIKDAGELLLHAIIDHVPAGREASLAKTKIEEAVMWAVKGLRTRNARSYT